MFKYYSCVKMTFWKVLHFLADMSKHICELMTFHKGQLVHQKSCQVIPMAHFAKSQRCPTYRLPSVTSLALVLGTFGVVLGRLVHIQLMCIMTPTNRSHELLKVTLGQNSTVTQGIPMAASTELQF